MSILRLSGLGSVEGSDHVGKHLGEAFPSRVNLIGDISVGDEPLALGAVGSETGDFAEDELEETVE